MHELQSSGRFDLERLGSKIERAIAQCSGDKIAAAALLGVGKSTLYRKLKKLGIS